jgi:hypothetical protein
LSSEDKKDRLQPVPEPDGEVPQVFAIRRADAGYELDRRSFWRALGGTAAGAAGVANAADAAGGCGAAKAHTQSVVALAFSADSKTLASGGAERLVKMWSVPSGALMKYQKSVRIDSASGLAYSADKKWLVSASATDRQIKLWAASKRKIVKTIECESADSVAISPNSKILAVGCNRSLKLFSLPDGAALQSLYGHTSAVTSVAVSPDGKVLASGSSDNTIRLWSLPEGQMLGTPRTAPAMRSVCFGTDGQLVVACGFTIRVYASAADNPFQLLGKRVRNVSAVASVPGGLLVSISDDNTMQIWSLADARLLKTVEVGGERLISLAVSADGKMAATGATDGTVRLWTLPAGEPGNCLYDPATIRKGTAMRKYRQMGPRTLTQPCGTPIPAGAVCICNCVASSISYRGTEQVCICDTISVPGDSAVPDGVVCVCNTIAVGSVSAPRAPRSTGGGGGYGGGHYWRPN